MSESKKKEDKKTEMWYGSVDKIYSNKSKIMQKNTSGLANTNECITDLIQLFTFTDLTKILSKLTSLIVDINYNSVDFSIEHNFFNPVLFFIVMLCNVSKQ